MSRPWMVLPEWDGERCYIVAGGPSVRDVSHADFQRMLRTGRVIVVNDSYRLVPKADVLYFADRKWWQRSSDDVARTFRGRFIVTVAEGIAGTLWLRNTGQSGLETDPGGLRTGNNSSYQAVNLAYHFGATEIVLVGVDMQVGTNGRTHWHDGHPGQTAGGFRATLSTSMLPLFQTLVEPLREANVTVVNASPSSALECWPKVPLQAIWNNGAEALSNERLVRNTEQAPRTV